MAKPSAKVLVIGGAGYIGATTAAALADQGHDVWIVDDLSTGHRELALEAKFVRAQAADPGVAELLKRERFDCVMHFAARSIVPESFAMRAEYYDNNVRQTETLLEAMEAAGTKRIVFSSSAAVFGDPGDVPILDESSPKKPLSPYGENKLEVERMLERRARESGLSSIALRYFNAAGAEDPLRVGEWHQPETHLIPRVIRAALADEPIEIFGSDYPTDDGTCIRDYIHVSDLADAHIAAMNRLLAGDGSKARFEAFNLGSECGYSVREVVASCEKALGRKLDVRERPRRPGDPACLVADSAMARSALGYEPKRDLDQIIRSAIEWERKRAGSFPHKAVFLDRDGTLNEDPGYLNDPAKMTVFPGIPAAMKNLKDAGFRLVVVSNQSGVARGIIELSALPKINGRLEELLEGTRIDHWELCIHHPDEDCECRKPKPKLILDSARKLGIDLSRSYMVGDKVSDLGSGWAAGCKATALVRTGHGRDAEAELAKADFSPAAFTGDSLREVSRWILDQEASASISRSSAASLPPTRNT